MLWVVRFRIPKPPSVSGKKDNGFRVGSAGSENGMLNLSG
jgi:hypothetical protein